MNATLIQDVVSEVMRRMGDARPVQPTRRAGGSFGVFNTVDDAVAAAEEAQKKLVKLSTEDRDGIVKLIKSIAKQNAREWGAMELAETKVGRLDHKIEKLQILELVPGVEFLQHASRRRKQWPLHRGIRAVRRDRRGHAGDAQHSHAFGQRDQHDRFGEFAGGQRASQRRELRRPCDHANTTNKSRRNTGSTGLSPASCRRRWKPPSNSSIIAASRCW